MSVRPDGGSKDGGVQVTYVLKKNGTIKGCSVAYRRKQRDDPNAKDASSPTVSLEAVLITAVVDAYKHRDVAIVNIPGAYFSADMDEEVHLCLRGRMAEMMARTAPEVYAKYVTLKNGKPILYVRLLKALYRCLRSALLFFNKLVADLEAYGFTINLYVPCVRKRW